MGPANNAKARIDRLEALSAWIYGDSSPTTNTSGWGLEDLSVAVGVTFELHEVDLCKAPEAAQVRYRYATCAERYRLFSEAVDLTAGFEDERGSHEFLEQHLALAWVFFQVPVLRFFLQRAEQSMDSMDFDQIELLSDELEAFLLSRICTWPACLIN